MTGGPSVAARWSETTSSTTSRPSNTPPLRPCRPSPHRHAARPRSRSHRDPPHPQSRGALRVVRVCVCVERFPGPRPTGRLIVVFPPPLGLYQSAGDTTLTAPLTNQDFLITVEDQAPAPAPPPEEELGKKRVAALMTRQIVSLFTNPAYRCVTILCAF